MSKADFSQYRNDIDKVWIYKLNSSYMTINKELLDKTGKRLDSPSFEINPNQSKKWGSWSPSNRVMMFSASLLRNYEWEAVEYVMRHEMAHQIVSEIFEMDCFGVAHGEAWKRACVMVDIEPARCTSVDFLQGFKGASANNLVEKIRKIIVHANDDAVTEQEAELFMNKARELMMRHDIAMQDVLGTDRVWVRRPFGPLFKRFPAYMWSLGRLLEEHYDVKNIKTYGPLGTSRLELFGEPEKLDIAEYVGHAILNQAEILYKQHKKGRNKEKNNSDNKENDYYSWGQKSRLSKRSFFEGLVRGYSIKLSQSKDKAKKDLGETIAKENAEKTNSRYTAGDCAVVPAYNKKLLNEMYGNAYPNMTNNPISASRGAGLAAGLSAGKNLTLSQGVNSGGNRGRLLT